MCNGSFIGVNVNIQLFDKLTLTLLLDKSAGFFIILKQVDCVTNKSHIFKSFNTVDFVTI